MNYLYVKEQLQKHTIKFGKWYKIPNLPHSSVNMHLWYIFQGFMFPCYNIGYYDSDLWFNIACTKIVPATL